jgi:hypothetical protein
VRVSLQKGKTATLLAQEGRNPLGCFELGLRVRKTNHCSVAWNRCPFPFSLDNIDVSIAGV